MVVDTTAVAPCRPDSASQLKNEFIRVCETNMTPEIAFLPQRAAWKALENHYLAIRELQLLDTASLSILCYEHDRTDQPAIAL